MGKSTNYHHILHGHQECQKKLMAPSGQDLPIFNSVVFSVMAKELVLILPP